MILLHHIIQILHLKDNNGGAMRRVVALDGGFMGLTAINRNRLGDTVSTDRFGQKGQRRFCIPLLREQKVQIPSDLVVDRWAHMLRAAHLVISCL
jgi:hypothetical protein